MPPLRWMIRGTIYILPFKTQFLGQLLVNDENLVVPAAMLICYLLDVNQEKAWRYVEKSLPWFLEANEYAQYEFAGYFLEGLNKLDRSVSVTLNLLTEFELYQPDHTYKLSELFVYFKDKATLLADAFDKRNASTTFTDRVASLFHFSN